MGDAYWKHGNGRPHPPSMTGQVAKRPRSEYEFPSGQIPDMPALFPRRDDMAGLGAIRETDSINASYDRYLRSRQMAPFGADGGRPVSGGLGGLPIFDEPPILPMGMGDPSILGKGRPIGMGGRPEIPLPPDASSTLFVEGLPSSCTRREVSHVFRPFVGYKEVRLITKESRHPGGDPLVLCFVDFETPAHAATAMDALQGYKFDETDRDSANLRLQFARYPGARSAGAHRGKR